MGTAVEFQDIPQDVWNPTGSYRARKKLHFAILVTLLCVALFFLFGDMVLSFVGYGYGGGLLDFCWFSLLIIAIILLSNAALRSYRHLLALGLTDDSVYRSYRVNDPNELIEVTENALKALHIDHTRFDPPGPTYTGRTMFPHNIRGMFRTRDPDLAIVVYSSLTKRVPRYKCDVVVGSVNGLITSEVDKVLQAIDEHKTVGRPALNIRSA